MLFPILPLNSGVAFHTILSCGSSVSEYPLSKLAILSDFFSKDSNLFGCLNTVTLSEKGETDNAQNHKMY